MTEAWLRWRKFVEHARDLPIGGMIRSGTVRGEKIAPEIIAGYEAPFPDRSYKAGALTWPLLVPVHPNDPGASEMLKARTVLSKWQKPVLVMFSDSDPYTHGFDAYFCKLIPTAKNRIVKDAGHFLQEDKGEEIAQHILAFIGDAPVR